MAGVVSKEELLCEALTKDAEGVEVNQIATLLGCDAKEAQDTLNALLAEHRVELVQAAGKVRVKMKKEEVVGLSNEERVLHSLIDGSGNKGIWIKNLRDMSGLSQLQIRKALKTLEQKKMVKAVKGVGTTKKCYMPYDAVEDVSLTGGTFYSDRQLDSELVQTLLAVCVAMLSTKRKNAMENMKGDLLAQKQASFATASDVVSFIRDKKILHVPIAEADIERILEVAVLDGVVERRGDGAVRAVENSSVRSSALVSVPCALCPVATDCAAGREINPSDCHYLNEWLNR